jgi:hypothetical protein
MRALLALLLLVAACGGTAEELAPLDAGHDAPVDVAREAEAATLDAREEPAPTRIVCRIANGGPDLDCDGGAFEIHVPGAWVDCRAIPCTPETECRAGDASGRCIEVPK